MVICSGYCDFSFVLYYFTLRIENTLSRFHPVGIQFFPNYLFLALIELLVAIVFSKYDQIP